MPKAHGAGVEAVTKPWIHPGCERDHWSDIKSVSQLSLREMQIKAFFE